MVVIYERLYNGIPSICRDVQVPDPRSAKECLKRELWVMKISELIVNFN